MWDASGSSMPSAQSYTALLGAPASVVLLLSMQHGGASRMRAGKLLSRARLAWRERALAALLRLRLASREGLG